MTHETPHTDERSLRGDQLRCVRCRATPVISVVRTEIGGTSLRRSSHASARLCHDCLDALRADPNTSFTSLFDDATPTARAGNHFIKVERL